MRSWPDDAHASLQDVDELWQLIKRGLAQDGTEPGNSFIVARRLADLISVFTDGHRAVLVDQYVLSVKPITALHEKNRARRAEFDAQRDSQHERRDQQQNEDRQYDVAATLDNAVDPIERRVADTDNGNAIDAVEVPLNQIGDENIRNEVDRNRGIAQGSKHVLILAGRGVA